MLRNFFKQVACRLFGARYRRQAFRREHPLSGPEALEHRCLLAYLYLDGWQKWEFPNGGFPFATNYAAPPPKSGTSVGHDFAASSWDSRYFGLSQFTQPGAFKLTEGEIKIEVRPSPGETVTITSPGEPVYVRMDVRGSVFNSYHFIPEGADRRRAEVNASGPHQLFNIARAGDFDSVSVAASYTYRARIGDVIGGNLPFSFSLTGDGYYYYTTGGRLAISWTIVSGPDLTADRIEYDAPTGDVLLDFGSTSPADTLSAPAAVYWSTSDSPAGRIGQPVWQGTFNRSTSNSQGPATLSHDRLQNPPQGAKYLVLIVDEANQVREDNEGNNSKGLKLATVDLAILSSNFQWRSVEDDGGFTFCYTVSADPGISFPDTTIKFYWANGPSQSQIIAGQLAYEFRINSGLIPGEVTTRKTPGLHCVNVLHNGPLAEFSLINGYRSPPKINATDSVTGNVKRAPYLVAIVDQATVTQSQGVVEERVEANNIFAVEVYPLVVHVVTPGYNPDPSDSGFLADFVALARALENVPAEGSILDGRVKSDVVSWDSWSKFDTGMQWLFAAKLADSLAQLEENLVIAAGWQALAIDFERVAAAYAGPADLILTAAAFTEAQRLRTTKGYLTPEGKGVQRLHLVGHSRGAGLNAVLAHELQRAGYSSIDYTALDGYASDWVGLFGTLTNISLSTQLSSVTGEKQNLIADRGLQFDYYVLDKLRASPLLNSIQVYRAIELLQSTAPIRAPEPPIRTGFSRNEVVSGSFHTTISHLYLSTDLYKQNYVGCNANKGTAAQLESGCTTNSQKSSALIGSTAVSSPPTSFNYGFWDGTIEQLGALVEYVSSTTPSSTGVSFIDNLRNALGPQTFVGEYWGSIYNWLVNRDGNHLIRCWNNSGGCVQAVVFPDRAQSIELDLTLLQAGTYGKVEIALSGATVGSFVLPEGTTSQHVSIPIPPAYSGRAAQVHIIGQPGLLIDNLAVGVSTNHAPTLSPLPVVLPPLRAGRPVTLNRGVSVSELVNGITDQDAAAANGIAIVSTESAKGRLEFSENSGVTWRMVTVNPSQAFLAAARPQNRIRFVPNAAFSGTVPAVFSFRAWDMTAGLQGISSIGTTGGETAFSTAVATASISITVNPWHNLALPLDVTGAGGMVDGLIAPGDALAIINFINAFGSGPVDNNASIGPPYYDTSDDEFVTAGDALAVINHLNAFAPGLLVANGEGEGTRQINSELGATQDMRLELTSHGREEFDNQLIDLLAEDVALPRKPRRR
jgi:Dockerin type I domain